MGKKDVALHGASKKERKALKAKAAELQAELAKREAKATKKVKPGKKGTPAAAEPVTDYDQAVADAKAERAAAKVKPSAKAKTIAAAEVTEHYAGNDNARIAAATARAAAVEANNDETDEQIKARVNAKRQRREELAGMADSIDRADTEAVSAYNAELMSLGGGDLLTSDAEKARVDARLKSDTIEKVEAAIDAVEEEVEALEQAQVVEQVETETGHVFAAGSAAPETDDLAKPSEAPKSFEDNVNGLGQYKVARPADGKVVGYTRTTTYIKNLEDRSNLERWKLRVMLEGVALNDTPDERGDYRGDPVVAQVRDLMHVRDVAVAKARKADRKGKLTPGELGALTDQAEKAFKVALDQLGEQLLELGGVHEKAQKGTDLHELCELYDRQGIDAVGDLLTEGKITPADLRDVEAYAEAMKRAGVKVVDIEQVVVNDELKVGGRLDRTVMAVLPGMQRATRMVADIKSGQVEYGAGTIAQQLEMYASSVGYDAETHERTDLKLSKTKGLLIHLPAGKGECYIYVVDLSLGRKGNGLSAQVRAWRNEGKRAIDFKTDLAAPAAE